MNSPAIDMSSLSLFYREVRQTPRLSREEEVRFARAWRDQGDREAARQLVVGNLYAVAGIAREYRHFGLPEMDLIQEGTLGLMHAVKRFDPDRGFRLMTYAAWWIRASIQDYILRSWSIVKLGTSKLQRKIFAGLGKAKAAIAALEGRNADEVGAEYGLSGIEYQEAATAFLQRDVSLSADEEGQAMVDSLPAALPTPEEEVAESDHENYRQKMLQSALSQLAPRDRAIIVQRHLTETPATLKDLSEIYGISVERVRQIEARAIQKLKAFASS